VRYAVISPSERGRRNNRRPTVSITWRKQTASPGPLGVQVTIRLRFAAASTRVAMSSAVASIESISAAEAVWRV
jgi:hypothetical protein